MRTLTAVLGALAAICAVSFPACRVLTGGKSGAGGSAGGDVIPYSAVERTLDNGLKVIVVKTGFPNLVSLQIPMQTGSRNEVEPGKTGFAHFFEHMMFRGTKTYSPEAYNAIITKAGARQNAFTSDDLTNYHVTFAKEDLDKILEIEADRFQHLEYPESAFKTEALAVLGEYNKNFANPLRKLFEVMQDAAFTTHPYKHTTMGFLADIEDMPNEFEYSHQFFDRWYRPEYASVIVVGDVDPNAVVAMVKKHFGAWQRGSQTVTIPQEPEPKGPVYTHLAWASPTPPYLVVGFHGPAFSETEKDSAALELLLAIEFGETSEIYKKLVIDEQRLDMLGADNAAGKDPSLLTVLSRVKDPKDVVRTRDEILKTCAAARTNLVSQRDLDEARAHQRYALSARLDNSEAIASTLARFVHFRRSFDTLNNLYRLYDTLTPDDLRTAARKYFTDSRLVITTCSHDALTADVARPPSIDSFATPAVAPEPAAPVADAIKSATPTAGGSGPANVVLKNESPQIVVKLAFRAGSAADPTGKEGLANLTSRMIADGGSARLTLAEIQKELYPIAGRFDAQVDRELTTFTGSIHKDNLGRFVKVALEQLTDPGWRDEDFKRVHEEQRNDLVVDLRQNNDEELGKERLQANVFRGTGYGHPPLGTVKGVDSLTLADVKAFAAANYTIENLTLGLSGDLPPKFQDELSALLRAKLARGESKSVARPKGAVPVGLSVDIVQKETRATAISFGFPIEVRRGHEDFVPLLVARTWLGEHRSSMSHLYQRIREIRGMNYGDYAYIEAFPNGGAGFFPQPNRPRQTQLFEVWIRPVPPEQGIFALKCALFELKKLVENGLTREDFESTREYLMKNVYLLTDGQSNELGYAIDSRFYGIDEYTKYVRDRLASVTLEQVNAAVKKHLATPDIHAVIVTKDGDGLKRELVAGDFTKITYNSEKPKELLDEDLVIGAMKLGLNAGNVTVTPLERVFEE